jgi:hypothetical protein
MATKYQAGNEKLAVFRLRAGIHASLEFVFFGNIILLLSFNCSFTSG